MRRKGRLKEYEEKRTHGMRRKWRRYKEREENGEEMNKEKKMKKK